MTPLVALSHDWFDWSVLVVGTIAAVSSAYLVYALRHDHSYAEFWKPRLQRPPTGACFVLFRTHVVQGSSPWKVRRYTLKFWADGKRLPDEAVVPRNDFPRHGAGSWSDDLSYELQTRDTPIEVALKVRFRGGGRYGFRRQHVEP